NQLIAKTGECTSLFLTSPFLGGQRSSRNGLRRGVQDKYDAAHLVEDRHRVDNPWVINFQPVFCSDSPLAVTPHCAKHNVLRRRTFICLLNTNVLELSLKRDTSRDPCGYSSRSP